MLGIREDEVMEVLVRVKPPQRLSRWSPLPIKPGHRSLCPQFYLRGEPDEPGDPPVMVGTGPVLFTDGRYVVTSNWDDYLLEHHDETWTPPRNFSADDPFGTGPRFYGPLRFGRYQAALVRRHGLSRAVQSLKPPLRLINWSVSDSSVGIVITGSVFGHRDHAPDKQIKMIPVFCSGRFVKAVTGQEYVLYDPSLEFRMSRGGHDPLRPLLGIW
jgi:hypothetical protein